MAEPADDEGKPLRKIAQSFKELAAVVNSQTADVEVAPFSHACTLVFPLLGYLVIAFKFAEMDFVPKALLEHDMERNCVRKAGSHSRNLLRVNRGLEMVRALFEQMIESDEDSFKNAVSKAYAQALAAHHGRAIRKAVPAGLYALPTREKMLKKVNEDGKLRRELKDVFIWKVQEGM